MESGKDKERQERQKERKRLKRQIQIGNNKVREKHTTGVKIEMDRQERGQTDQTKKIDKYKQR